MPDHSVAVSFHPRVLGPNSAPPQLSMTRHHHDGPTLQGKYQATENVIDMYTNGENYNGLCDCLTCNALCDCLASGCSQ